MTANQIENEIAALVRRRDELAAELAQSTANLNDALEEKKAKPKAVGAMDAVVTAESRRVSCASLIEGIDRQLSTKREELKAAQLVEGRAKQIDRLASAAGAAHTAATECRETRAALNEVMAITRPSC